MLITILQKINNLNELFFHPIDQWINQMPIPEWMSDGLIDCMHLLPFLFVIFVIIEILEFYYSERINNWITKSEKAAPLAGALASIFPQCGFSVIASSLYSKRIITRGTLIAVYLGTSDESIPILLAYPQKAYLILPIIGIKLFIATLMGYFVDFIIPQKECLINNITSPFAEEGCCNHKPDTTNKKELILHPILHTINTLAYILVITLVLNYLIQNFSISDYFISANKYYQCFIASIIGLIPNCAISITVTMMLIKGSLSFGSTMSALLSGAGLGVLVLIKNNKFKDTSKIILLLFCISFISGCIIEFIF